MVSLPFLGKVAQRPVLHGRSEAAAFGSTAMDQNTLYINTTGKDFEYLSSKPATVSGKTVEVEVGH